MEPSDGPDLSLAAPGRIPLILSSNELQYLVAYLLDELNTPDSERLDATAQKLNAYLLSVKDS